MRTLSFILLLLMVSVMVFGQARMSFDNQIIDNTIAFIENTYDTALVRKNNVESCHQGNITFYFDQSGRLSKSSLILDSINQIEMYYYDYKGNLIKTEISSPKYQSTIITTLQKTYMNERLIKDSSNFGLCKHFEYNDDGSLRQELWFGFDMRFDKPNHRLRREVRFDRDSAGRQYRIVDRNYMISKASKGQLISDRTLVYDDKNQLIREEETVKWKKDNRKAITCPNAGSANFLYDLSGRLIDIRRKNGPSQTIKYLSNGLISDVETYGNNCEGKPYHWHHTYSYTYRNQ